MMPPVLSFVVCTHNGARFIEKNLPVLLGQIRQQNKTDAVEVIVVDNNSTDNLAVVMADIIAVHPSVKMVSEPKQGLSHARNKGCQEAAGIYVAYIDDDACIKDEWITAFFSVIVSSDAALLGGPVYPVFEAALPWWIDGRDFVRLANYPEGSLPNDRAEKGFLGGNMIIKRRLLTEMNGFNPSFGMVGDRVALGEEVDFAQRVYERYGNVTYYHENIAIDHHEAAAKLTLAGYKKRASAAGSAMHALRKKAGKSKLHMAVFPFILIGAGLALMMIGLTGYKGRRPSTGITRFYQGISFLKSIYRHGI